MSSAAETLRTDLLTYTTLAADPPADLDPWERRHLDRLAELAAGALDHLDGDTLVHCDLRADNIIIGPGHDVWFVDWPWAFRGAQWPDQAIFLINAALYGHDPELLLAADPVLSGTDPRRVTGLLAGLAGMWAVSSRQPAPAALPTIREFRRANHDVTLAWVRRRLNDD